VQVLRRMYCFQESDPASLPQPVALLPPKAPPISAPLVGQLMFTMPESAPLGPSHLNKSVMLDVNNDELNPASTSLFHSITLKITNDSVVENNYSPDPSYRRSLYRGLGRKTPSRRAVSRAEDHSLLSAQRRIPLYRLLCHRIRSFHLMP